MTSAAIILLVLYAAAMTWLMLRLKGRADRVDELEVDLRSEQEARRVENENYYKANRAWVVECEDLKELARRLSADLSDCRTKLRTITKADTDPAG